MTEEQLNKLSYDILGAAFEVRRHLGRFLYEETYELALIIELQLRGIKAERQVPIPITYKGQTLSNAKRMDIVVENEIVLELKALECMGDAEISQIMTYLIMGNYKLGFLLNFGAFDFSCEKIPEDHWLYKGIYRFANSKISLT